LLRGRFGETPALSESCGFSKHDRPKIAMNIAKRVLAIFAEALAILGGPDWGG